MKTRFIYTWKQLIGSFWFVPLSIVAIAILAAFGLVYLDTISQYKPSGVYHYLISGGSDSARSILSTIAGAMIGLAGTVFSITLVALTMASSQFGPRMLQNFMYDRINQIVLGSYIATFIYSIIVLKTVKSIEESQFVPNLSILFAILLAVSNIILLVIFIHHTAMQIQADQVVANINKSMHKNIDELISRESKLNNSKLDSIIIKQQYEQYHVTQQLRTIANGYLQAIDIEGLIALGKEYEILIDLNFRPGDFLIIGDKLLTIYSHEKCSQLLISEIHRCFITGKRRTATQDADFGIHQMVEIAARALSPGVNDPYTAINCIDNLTAIMCYATQLELPKEHFLDENKVLRLIVKPLTFEKLMDTSFTQIRRYGSTTPHILIRLMDSLLRIDTFANTNEQSIVIKKHIEIVLTTAEKNLVEEADLIIILEKYNKYINKE